MSDTIFRGLDARRRKRWEAGVQHYRGGFGDFVGNPLDELIQELEDGLNYVEECARQGSLTAWGAGTIDEKLRECVHVIATDVEKQRRETQG